MDGVLEPECFVNEGVVEKGITYSKSCHFYSDITTQECITSK